MLVATNTVITLARAVTSSKGEAFIGNYRQTITQGVENI